MNIFVGCSSKNEIPKEYVDDSKKLLTELFKENDLVFGADDTGLMGLSYNIALKNGRNIIGICPELYKHDFERLNCNQEIITRSVNDRNDEVIKNSDVLLFLPGGIGTICEMFAAIETKRNHEHNKPVIIYNSNNYYKELISLLDKMYKEKFATVNSQEYYVILNTVEDVYNYIDSYNKESSKVKVLKKINILRRKI